MDCDAVRRRQWGTGAYRAEPGPVGGQGGVLPWASCCLDMLQRKMVRTSVKGNKAGDLEFVPCSDALGCVCTT